MWGFVLGPVFLVLVVCDHSSFLTSKRGGGGQLDAFTLNLFCDCGAFWCHFLAVPLVICYLRLYHSLVILSRFVTCLKLSLVKNSK